MKGEFVKADNWGDAHKKVRSEPFQLTDAVRPATRHGVVPRQAYRIDIYRDRQYRIEVPVLAASISKPALFEVFLGLLEPFGEVVDVVLESSHGQKGSAHLDFLREEIDRPVLESHLCDFEELLVNDGCAGIAVLATECPMELQFDEHKGFVVYAPEIKPFVQVLRQAGIHQDDTVRLLSEGEHLHNSDPRFKREFDTLCYRLGVGETAERVNW